MKLLKILQVPEITLNQKSERIAKITPDILELIDSMKFTLIRQEKPKGVGLSAVQVGELLQLLVVRESDKKLFRVFINPIITLRNTTKKKEKKKSFPEQLEGCLSISNVWGIVERASAIEITYMNEYGEVKAEIIKGFLANIIQHEYDHLQGILFTQRVTDAKKELYFSHEDKGEEIFTVIEKDAITRLTKEEPSSILK